MQGCGTLDGFILRTVGNPNEPQSKASHCPQKRPCNSSPLEEVPVEVLDSSKASQASSDVEIREQPASSRVSRASSDVEILEQPASPDVDEEVKPESDPTVPHARALEDCTASQPEELNDLARPVADSTLARGPPSLDIAVDELTVELATLCLERLEKCLALGNDTHEAGGTNDFEEELQVNILSQSTYETHG